jgi:hypothetical protein
MVYVDLASFHKSVADTFWDPDSGRLVKLGLILVPTSKLRTVCLEVHDRGHYGHDKSLSLLRRRYSGEGIAKVMGELVASCFTCQATKSMNRAPYGCLAHLPVPTDAFSEISMDYLSLPSVTDARGTTYNFLLVVLCRLTGYCLLHPCTKNITGPETAQVLLDKWFGVFGFPAGLLSDNDPRLSSQWWDQFVQTAGISHRTTLTYRPQGNGAVEKINGKFISLLKALSVATAPKRLPWTALLRHISWNLNDLPGVSGLSANFMVFGKELVGPGDDPVLSKSGVPTTAADWFMAHAETTARVREVIKNIHEKAAKQYDKRRQTCSFAPGELVWLGCPPTGVESKPMPRWTGPYVVESRVGPLLSLKSRGPPFDKFKAHAEQCKPVLDGSTWSQFINGEGTVDQLRPEEDHAKPADSGHLVCL